MYRSTVRIKDAGGYEYDLDQDKVMTDDVTLRHEYQVGYSQLWLIGNEFGPLAAVWASHESDALDAAVNANLLDSLLLEESDLDAYHESEYTRAGNASEPFESAHLWIKLAPIGEQTTLTQIRFGECRGAAVDNMGAL